MNKESRSGRAAIVAAALIGPLVALLWLDDALNPLLRYERAPILAGEWWRLITGHMVHLDAAHLALNAAVILAWLYLFEPREGVAAIVATVFAYALLTGLGMLLFSAELDWMLGASAITYALVGGSALRAALDGPRRLGLVLLAALGLKVFAEQVWGLESWFGHLVDYPIASVAHAHGIAAGFSVEAARRLAAARRARPEVFPERAARVTLKRIAGSLLAISLVLSASPARALTEGSMSLSALVERANEIVVGTVFEMTGAERFFGDYARIVTDVTLVDVEVVKGETAEVEMVVTQLGGRVGDVMEWYPGLPALEMARRYLVFLVRTDLGVALPIGLQGVFIVETDPARAAEVVTSASGAPVLGVLDDRVEFGVLPEGPAGAGDRLAGAMTLERFLAEIRDRVH